MLSFLGYKERLLTEQKMELHLCTSTAKLVMQRFQQLTYVEATLVYQSVLTFKTSSRCNIFYLIGQHLSSSDCMYLTARCMLLCDEGEMYKTCYSCLVPGLYITWFMQLLICFINLLLFFFSAIYKLIILLNCSYSFFWGEGCGCVPFLYTSRRKGILDATPNYHKFAKHQAEDI